MRKITLALTAFTVGMLGFVGTAAAAPTPPVPETVAGDVLASFAEKLIDIVLAMATNVWVLALFGLGIAFAIVRKVLSKGASKTTRVVG